MFFVDEHKRYSTSKKVHEKMFAHIEDKTNEKIKVYIVSENDNYLKTERATPSTDDFSLIQKKQFEADEGKGKYEFEIKFENL